MSGQEKKQGKLFVISGPSGVGKGTLIQKILDARSDLAVSVSYTSREPRSDETDGVGYYFVTRAVFEEMIARNEFIEYALVHRNYYGTSRCKLQELLTAGRNVLFELDVQGGLNLAKQFADVRLIFVLPPNEEELIRRINNRGSETPETLSIRLETARSELAVADSYDYQVVNKDLEGCIDEINKIIDKEIGTARASVRVKE